MATHYDVAVRVDAVDCTALVGVLTADGGSYLVVKELEDTNPHFHCYLRTARKLPAVRAALKRAMPELNGNGSYSVSNCRDVERYLRYMLKGESVGVMPQVVAANGLGYQSDEWQKSQHDAYWEENAQIGRKRKLMSVADSVLAACKEKKLRWDDRDAIAELYIRELVSRDKAINLFSVRSNTSLLQCKLCPDDTAIKLLAGHCVNY